MRPTHLLDTSVYSQPLRKHPLASVRKRWDALGDNRLCSSVICEGELWQGLEHRGSERLWKAYREVLQHRLPLLSVDERVAQVFGRMAGAAMRCGLPRPPLDLLIAATASAHGLIVATLNYKDFATLEGVAVEDWSTA